MPNTTLLGHLRGSELLSSEQLSELAALPEATNPDPKVLGKVVLQRGWLTRFQISMIAAGKSAELLVGSYVLLDRLGEGGMGQVFKARHRHMKRMVALKLMRREKLQSADSVQRFYQEVEAAAKLTHPNIVLAFDAGKAGNTHFFSMELVDGPDLTHLVREKGVLPVPQACEFIRQAAIGLQHAHERGLVHRDIKPSNLLVSVAEGDPVVKILDLGLARLGDSFSKERNLTKMGQVIGTPDYLAPEQALDARAVDIRADIYSLGCSLFFLLSGRAPFKAEALAELLMKHQMEEAPSVRALRPDVPVALDSLVRRMMAKKPDQRPSTPTEVVAALEPFTRGEEGTVAKAVHIPPVPIVNDRTWSGLTEDGAEMIKRPAKRSSRDRSSDTLAETSRPKRKEKEKKKNNLPLLIGAGVGAGLLLVGGIVGAIFAFSSDTPKTTNQVTLTEPDRDKSKEKGKDKRGGTDAEPRGEAPAVVREEAHARFTGHGMRTTAVAVSSDGKLAASGDGDGVVLLWDLAALAPLKRLGKVSGPVSSLAFARGASRLLASASHKLHEWDIPAGSKTGKAGRPGTWLLPRGQVALTVEASDGQQFLRSWQTDTGEAKGSVSLTATHVVDVAVNASGKAAYVLGERAIDLVDLAGQRVVKSLNNGAGFLQSKAICGQTLDEMLLGEAGGRLRLFPIDPTKGPRFLRAGPNKAVTALAMTADGTKVLVGSDDGTVTLTGEGTTGTPSTFTGHVGAVGRICFCPDGKRALSVGEDGTVWLWNLDKPTSTPVPPVVTVTPGAPVDTATDDLLVQDLTDRVAGQVHGFRMRRLQMASAAFLTDKEQALLMTGDEIVCYSLNPVKRVKTLFKASPFLRMWVRVVSPDRKTIAVVLGSKVQVIDAESGKIKRTLDHPSGVACLAFSPDAKYLACGSNGDLYRDGKVITDGPTRRPMRGDYGVRMWNLETGKEERRFRGFATGIRNIAFSGDGTLLMASNHEQPLEVWDVKTGKVPATFTPPEVQGYLALQPVGQKQVLLGALNGKIHLFDLVRSRFVKTFQGHSFFIHSLTLLPDGKQFVSTSGMSGNPKRGTAPRDCTLRLWDIDKGSEIGRATFPEPVWSVAITPDGVHALACENKGAFRLLDLRKLAVGDTAVVRSDVPADTKKRFVGHTDKINSICFSRDGKRLLTGSEDGTARSWYVDSGEQELSYSYVRGAVYLARFSPVTGKGLLVVGEGGLGSYYIPSESHTNTLSYPHQFGVRCADMSSDQKTILLGGANLLKAITLARDRMVANGQNSKLPFELTALVSLGDATNFALGDSMGQVHIWNAAMKKETFMRKNHNKAVVALACHAKASLLVSIGADKALMTRNLKKLTTFHREMTTDGPLTSVAISGDGKYFVTGSKDGTVRVWSAALRSLKSFKADGEVLGVAFAPDGKSVASCGKDVRLWKLDSLP